MQIGTLADPDAVTGRAATLIAAQVHTAVTERGRFVIAVSDGHTQWMILTYSFLDRSRHILWLVTSQDKAAIPCLTASDHEIPAGRVRQNNALLLNDLAAAGSWQRGA